MFTQCRGMELDFNQSAPKPHDALIPEWISCVEYRVVSKDSTQWVQEVFDKDLSEFKTECTHCPWYFSGFTSDVEMQAWIAFLIN